MRQTDCVFCFLFIGKQNFQLAAWSSDHLFLYIFSNTLKFYLPTLPFNVWDALSKNGIFMTMTSSKKWAAINFSQDLSVNEQVKTSLIVVSICIFSLFLKAFLFIYMRCIKRKGTFVTYLVKLSFSSFCHL